MKVQLCLFESSSHTNVARLLHQAPDWAAECVLCPTAHGREWANEMCSCCCCRYCCCCCRVPCLSVAIVRAREYVVNAGKRLPSFASFSIFYLASHYLGESAKSGRRPSPGVAFAPVHLERRPFNLARIFGAKIVVVVAATTSSCGPFGANREGRIFWPSKAIVSIGDQTSLGQRASSSFVLIKRAQFRERERAPSTSIPTSAPTPAPAPATPNLRQPNRQPATKV